MRPILKSECRMVANMVREIWACELRRPDTVYREWYTPSGGISQPRQFNASFSIEFVEEVVGKQPIEVGMSTILPDAVGAEVFLTVDKQTHSPMMLEMLGGEAFEIKYFEEYVGIVESVLYDTVRAAPSSAWQQALCHLKRGTGLDDTITLREAAFSRGFNRGFNRDGYH